MSEVIATVLALGALGTTAYMYYNYHSTRKQVKELRKQVAKLTNSIVEVKTTVSRFRHGVNERLTILMENIEDVSSKTRYLEDKVHLNDKKVEEVLEHVKKELSRIEEELKRLISSVDSRVDKLEIAYTGISARTRRMDEVEKKISELENTLKEIRVLVDSIKKKNVQPTSREERDRILVEKWLNTPIEDRSVNKIAREFGIHPSTAMRILRKYLGENYRNATWRDYGNAK